MYCLVRKTLVMSRLRMYRLAIACRDEVFASVMSPVLEVELPRFATTGRLYRNSFDLHFQELLGQL